MAKKKQTINKLRIIPLGGLHEIGKNMTVIEIPFEIDPGIVRGLDYYTRTVFEFV